MKKIFFLTMGLLMLISLHSALIITRSEMGFVSKELYHQNIYAELHFDHIVQIWDFNSFELTLINHELQIYTTVDFETFKGYAERQNQAEINTELRNFDEERRNLMAEATNRLFASMRPHFTTVDSIDVFGYKAFEFHVFNSDIITQKIWISNDLQNKINQEINPVNIKRVEQVFKDNREDYFKAIGIRLDPVTMLIESLETTGYVVQRVDYGLRNTRDLEYEAEIDKLENVITDIIETRVDPFIFSYHQRFRQLDYNAYHIALIRHAESLE